MQKAPQSKNEHLDYWIMAMSVVGILVFLFLLYDDSWWRKSRVVDDRLKIGSISKPLRDVRRRTQDDFIWLPLSNREPLFYGDSIYTGNDSTATVELVSGISLWIDPDSLVVLDQTSEAMKLDLKFGNVRGRLAESSNTALKLNINNQELDLSGKSVEFMLQKAANAAPTSLRVSEGIANITEPKTRRIVRLLKKQEIKMDRSVASIATIIPQEEAPVFVRREQWGMHRNLWFAQKQPLKFVWETEGPVEHYELLISQKADMKKIIHKESMKVNGFEWQPPFDEGTFYWKVRAVGNGDRSVIETEPIQWNIGLLLAPEWNQIPNPLTFSVRDLAKNPNSRSENRDPNTILKWSSNLKTVIYRLEWSSDEKFSKVQFVEVKENQWHLPAWEEGLYFLRVRSEGLGRPSSLWSLPLLVRVNEKDPDGLLPPPIAKTQIETLEKVEPMKLEWPAQEKASGYTVEVSDQPDFSKILSSESTKKTVWSASAVANGVRYLRIFPLAASNRRGPPSPVITWYARTKAPEWVPNTIQLSVAIPRDEKDQLLAIPETWLKWKEMSSEKSPTYELEWSENADFTSPQIEKLAEPKFLLKDAKIGTRYFRVRSVYTNDKKSLVSTILKVDIFESQPDGFVPPQLARSSFESQLDGDKPALANLSWKPIANAVKFNVQLSRTSDFKETLVERMFNSPSAMFSYDKPGQFFLRVAAVSKSDRTGPWSQSVSWKIRLGTPSLKPIADILVKLDSEESNIPPSSAVIHWTAPNLANQFKLQIAEDNEFNKINLDKEVSGREFNFPLTKNGQFKVRIQTLQPNGLPPSSFSPVVSFKYIIGRPIKVPRLLSPNDKVSYILSKMKNPEIWLEWDGIKNANSYQVEFAKDKSFTQILHTLTVPEKRVLLDHKSIRGKIYWRVKAKNSEQDSESGWSSVWSLAVVDIENED